MEVFVMSHVIDELLQEHRFNIYSNENMKQEDINILVKEFCKMEAEELKKYLSMEKASSKVCWLNYVCIIKEMPYPQKIEEISILFEFLKDINWPAAQESMKVIAGLKKKDIVVSIEKFLKLAYEEGDDMWISGIYILSKQIGISQEDFINKEIYKVFQFRNF